MMKRVVLVALFALLVCTLPPLVWGHGDLSGDSQSLPAAGGVVVETRIICGMNRSKLYGAQ
jgi:hypothetical protein